MIPTETLSRLRAAEDSMTALQAQQAVRSLASQITEAAQTDILAYARWVRTRDEADPTSPVKAMPMQLDYIRRLLALMASEQRLAVVKSRQLLVSWAACVYMTWRARFVPHQHVIYQTQNWPDAVKMVAMPGSGGFAGRCEFIERHLPAWMQQKVETTEGRIVYANGSLIEALPGGADKVRGKTASVIVLDEMAFLEDAKGTYTAIAPLVQKGAHLVMISTPNGGEGNVFFHLWHGTPMAQLAAA